MKILERDIVGETYNVDGRPTVGAVAYGVASNGGHVLRDDTNYVKPELVSRLPNVVPTPKAGPLELVEEVI